MSHPSFIADNHSPAVIPPPEAAVDFPALPITRPRFDRTPTRRLAALTAFKRWDGRLNTPPAEALTPLTAVVGFVGDPFLRARTRAATPLRDSHRRQGSFHQVALMRWRSIHIHTHGHPMAIGPPHSFAALADLRLPDAGSPFFAGTKLPSRKACAHSSLPWASSWLNSVRPIRSHVPSPDHAHNRRQQVAGEPYPRGTSSQGHPVFSTKRMPLRGWRASFRFRPGPGVCSGIKDSMTAHGSSVMSCRLMPLVYRALTEF